MVKAVKLYVLFTLTRFLSCKLDLSTQDARSKICIIKDSTLATFFLAHDVS